MTVLVTGASGFMGSALCRAIHAAGREVTGLARHTDAPGGFRGRWIATDIAAITPEFPEGTGTVFHLAGKAHAISETKADDAEYTRVNVGGTRRALDAAAACGAQCFVLVSSVKVFGDDQQRTDRALTEDDTPVPDTPYGRSKLEAEALVLADTRIPRRVVIRPALVYGPGVKGNLERMLEAVKRGRFPPLPEVGNRRSLVHVDDLVAAAMCAASDPRAAGRVFQVTDGEVYSTRRLYLALCAAAGREPAGWAMPSIVLRMAALGGDAAGAIRRRRAPFDTAAFHRLSESAWFSGDHIRAELGWKALKNVESWCTSRNVG